MPDPVNIDSVKMAVEITKASVPMQSGSFISSPESVATFIEVVARKIDELRFPKD